MRLYRQVRAVPGKVYTHGNDMEPVTVDYEAAANVLCKNDMAPGPDWMLGEVSRDIADAYRNLTKSIINAALGLDKEET